VGFFDGDKKAELAAHVSRLETQVDHFKEENGFLRKQVEKLQEALFAKESPVAYQQMKMDEAAMEAPSMPTMSEEELHKRKIEREVMQRHITDLEAGRPLFADAEEMESALIKMIGSPQTEPIHDNTES